MSGGRQSSKVRRKTLDARQVVDRKEVIDVLKRHLHPTCQRLVARRAKERIQPDQARTTPPYASQLSTKKRRIATVPPI